MLVTTLGDHFPAKGQAFLFAYRGDCYPCPVKTSKVISVSDFIGQVHDLRDQWLPHTKELWFRGEDASYQDTKLQPKLYRPVPGKGIRTVEESLEIEDKLYREFVRCARQLSEVNFDDEWDWYFLTQHHGVPTRLLDWTDGALIALHFALRNKTAERDRPLVWVLDPYWLNDTVLKPHADRADAKARWDKFCILEKNSSNCEENDPEDWDRLYLTCDEDDRKEPLLATPKIPLLFDIEHITRRVAAQRSQMMIFGTEASWLFDLAGMEDSRFAMLCVEPKQIEQMKWDLRDAGVTESVIYPDLDGLGRELEQFWEAVP